MGIFAQCLRKELSSNGLRREISEMTRRNVIPFIKNTGRNKTGKMCQRWPDIALRATKTQKIVYGQAHNSLIHISPVQ